MSPARLLGEVVARGSRSVVHAYGHGAVVKVPKPATPAGWILAEAKHVEAVRAVGAPAPALLGVEEVFGRPALSSSTTATRQHRDNKRTVRQVQIVHRPGRNVRFGGGRKGRAGRAQG